jgi:hypothetical protein
MKTILIASLALLSLPGMVWSMEESPARGMATYGGRGGASTARPDNSAEMRIFELRYYPARELAVILTSLTTNREIRVVQDDRGNRIIVTAPPERLQEIERLVQVMDVPPATGPQTHQMMCRVYMLEVPPEDQGLKPFDLVIETSEQLLATSVLTMASASAVQISTFRQTEPLSRDYAYTIQGRAVSNEAVKRMLEALDEASPSIRDLRWENATLTSTVPAAQITQLPAPLQEHIRRLLGQEVETIGYWFGNLSIPGQVKAPLSDWVFEMNVEPEQDNDLRLEVRVTWESQIGPDTWRKQEILANSVRSKVGKPIIIGYNRDRYGTRTMGAMVIVPEMETAAAETKSR